MSFGVFRTYRHRASMAKSLRDLLRKISKLAEKARHRGGSERVVVAEQRVKLSGARDRCLLIMPATAAGDGVVTDAEPKTRARRCCARCLLDGADDEQASEDIAQWDLDDEHSACRHHRREHVADPRGSWRLRCCYPAPVSPPRHSTSPPSSFRSRS